MQTAAMTSRFLIGYSSKAGFADSEIVVSHGGLIQHIVVSHLAQTACSQDAFLKLTNALIQFAEQAYTLRDLDALEEASRVLMNLPIDGARQVGLYYHALAINRNGQRDEAETLLETVADNAPFTYRARAIQTLGANHHDKGHLDEALRFQLEALRLASDRNASGLQSTVLARWEISIIKSVDGDHKGALSDLKSLSPLVNQVAKQKPFYFYAYCNALAIELGELGHIEEAEGTCEIALACPFASAYPEWAETRQELDAKRTSATPSVVAINRAQEAEPSPQVEPQRQPEPTRALTFSCPASDKDSSQRSIVPIPATATIALNAISILVRVLICIGPRAPPVRL
ncbi:MAG: tetratricopeptide repeat protein [Acidobacteriota bacterium]